MEFLLFMGIGTVVAVWVVTNLPKNRSYRRPSVLPGLEPPIITTQRNQRRVPEVWQYHPMDESEYQAALNRHSADPVQNPFPSPIPRQNQ